MNLITDKRYCFDKSVFDTDGAVYDLGCLTWDWWPPFQGRKQYVGVDPCVNQAPRGAEIVTAAVTPYSGRLLMRGYGEIAHLADPSIEFVPPVTYPVNHRVREDSGLYEVPAITWGELTAMHGPAAMVKMNIEGAEIPLLFSVQQPMAPQIVVTFHYPDDTDSVQPNMPPARAIDACLAYLNNWYDICETTLIHYKNRIWYVCVQRS